MKIYYLYKLHQRAAKYLEFISVIERRVADEKEYMRRESRSPMPFLFRSRRDVEENISKLNYYKNGLIGRYLKTIQKINDAID